MNDFFRRQFGIAIKAAADGGARAFDVIASTEDVDLDGEVLVQDWDLRRFEKNPVVLYFHNLSGIFSGEPEHSLPVGFATNTRIEQGKLLATINFVDEKANPLAEKCFQGFKQGSLRAVSVGFRPKSGAVEMRAGADVYVLRGNELLEISVCPVPVNPNAVTTEARAASADALRAFVKSHHTPSSTASPESEDMKSLAKALGLNENASEAEILTAINALGGTAKALEMRLLTATSAKSVDEAFGTIAAGATALTELAKANAEITKGKKAIDKRDREGLVAKGVAEKKLTPALRDWALETVKDASGQDTGDYVQSLETIKSFLAKAPVIAALPDAKSGDGKPTTEEASPTEVPGGGALKGYEQMPPAEKHNLKVTNPAVYDAVKADWERRGKPAPQWQKSAGGR